MALMVSPKRFLSWEKQVSICQRWPYFFFGNRVAICFRYLVLGSLWVGRPAVGGMMERTPRVSRAKMCAPSLSYPASAKISLNG